MNVRHLFDLDFSPHGPGTGSYKKNLIGGIAGFLLGVGGLILLSMVSGWSTAVSKLSVILAFGFSGLVGIFFSFYPVDKASLPNPIDALRCE